jgi:hypothetical protein
MADGLLRTQPIDGTPETDPNPKSVAPRPAPPLPTEGDARTARALEEKLRDRVRSAVQAAEAVRHPFHSRHAGRARRAHASAARWRRLTSQ